MRQAPFTSRRWQRVEYERLVDVGVFEGEPLELIGGHLIVAESSLVFDRTHKGSLYARAGIADYWIVNLEDRVVEVCREPAADLTAPFRWWYTSMSRFGAADSVTPLAVPVAPVPLSALLP